MTIPYVVGQWVRGERFYGREEELSVVLDSRRSFWVAGTRRIGKTSLLRQAEHLGVSRDSRVLPLVWDFQGVENSTDLQDSFHEALLDAGPRMSEFGLALPSPGEAPAAVIRRFAAVLSARGRKLLLLADEAEDLAALAANAPGDLDEFLAALTLTPGVRFVLAGSLRLAALAARSPQGERLLRAVTPPLFLGGLSSAQARTLIRQENLPARARPSLDDTVVEGLCAPCGGHPFLLQLLAKRVAESGDLPGACAAVATDPMVHYLFSADLALLEEADRRLLRALAGGGADSDPQQTVHLEALGLLRRGTDGRAAAGNRFLEQWLRRTAAWEA